MMYIPNGRMERHHERLRDIADARLAALQARRSRLSDDLHRIEVAWTTDHMFPQFQADGMETARVQIMTSYVNDCDEIERDALTKLNDAYVDWDLYTLGLRDNG